MNKLSWTIGPVLSHYFVHYLFHNRLWKSPWPWQWTTISVLCSSLFLLRHLLLYSRPSWQATIHPTMGQKPPWQTKVLISLIMNQYAAGSPSREDFTKWMHLFSTSTARDEWRDGGEYKDISDSNPGCCAGSKCGGITVDVFLFFVFKVCFNSFTLIAH